MVTRNINLTRQQDAFVRKLVESGNYQNASETVRAALRVFEQRLREDSIRLKALKAELALGLADLEAGRYDEVKFEDLKEYLNRLGRRAKAKVRRR